MTKIMILLLSIVCCLLPAAAQSHTFSGSVGYNYQNSDQGQGFRANLNGWFAAGQFDFNDHLSVEGEADSYYGRLQDTPSTQQNFVIGPQYTFRADEAKVRPYIYLQAGDQRSSSAGNVDHAVDLQIGTGLQFTVTPRLAVQLAPAEYNFAYGQVGSTHNYSA